MRCASATDIVAPGAPADGGGGGGDAGSPAPSTASFPPAPQPLATHRLRAAKSCGMPAWVVECGDDHRLRRVGVAAHPATTVRAEDHGGGAKHRPPWPLMVSPERVVGQQHILVDASFCEKPPATADSRQAARGHPRHPGR
ncbi:MAG: hypothetical protein V9G12_17660 [Microthrixaceae bacterium]